MIRAMELEDIKKELDAIKVEEMNLESLRELERQAETYEMNLKRSEVELRNYRVDGAFPWLVISSEIIDAQRELCDKIRAQAKLYDTFVGRVSDEIDKQLETLYD